MRGIYKKAHEIQMKFTDLRFEYNEKLIESVKKVCCDENVDFEDVHTIILDLKTFKKLNCKPLNMIDVLDSKMEDIFKCRYKAESKFIGFLLYIKVFLCSDLKEKDFFFIVDTEIFPNEYKISPHLGNIIK